MSSSLITDNYSFCFYSFVIDKKDRAKRFFISSIFPLIKKYGLQILSQAREDQEQSMVGK